MSTAAVAQEQTRPLNLRQKLVQVYSKIDHVEKAGTNEKQKYTFVRAADVLRAIRNAFAELGIYAETNYELLGSYDIKTNSGGVMHTATVKATIVLYDTDSDETKTISGIGDGADSGDKGVYKAQTGATKNALRNASLLPDTADPEADETVDEATQPQQEKPKRQSRPVENAVESFTPPFVSNPAMEVPVAGGPLPNEKEMEAFGNRTRNLTLTLSDEKTLGNDRLKPGPGRKPVARKVLAYILRVNSIPEEDGWLKLTKAQWENFFKFADTMLKQENGAKQLIQLVEDKKGE